jgi:hypothetical protein
MSRCSTISANTAGQIGLGRPSSFHLPSPAVTVALLIVCVFVLRLPSTFVPRELNPDESQFLIQAMKFLVDPRPWLAGDTGNAGPFTSYFISAFLWMGFKPGFVLLHMLANVFVCLEVLTGYLTLRRIGSETTAAVGAFVMVLFYGLATHWCYLHYANELLPNLLLMVGFYLFLEWLDEPEGRRAGVQLGLLFSGGLVLGAAPWCKLQAVPITGVLGLVVLAAIFKDKGPFPSFSSRVKELVAFCVGAVLTTCFMLAILIKCGAIEDFWHSYIQGGLAYVGPLSLADALTNFLFLFFTWPFRQPWLVALLGVGLLIHASRSGDIPHLFKERKWACIGLLAYAGATIFAVLRSPYPFPSYSIFLVPPMTYLVASSFRAFAEVTDLRKSMLSSQRLIFVVLVLLFATIDGARYANMIRSIHELSHSQPDLNAGIAKVGPHVLDTDSNDTIAKMKHILACSTIKQCSWVVEDSNERIAAVVREIQKARPVRSLAIWGWAPGVYVVTGILPATRDSLTFFQISQGPMRNYFRARFLDDLSAKPPDLFIDAVAPGANMWHWTENDGYESDPQLRKFIEDNYILVDRLTLVKGAKAIRFFARREPTS